jgi:hypothetical protein
VLEQYLFAALMNADRAGRLGDALGTYLLEPFVSRLLSGSCCATELRCETLVFGYARPFSVRVG